MTQQVLAALMMVLVFALAAFPPAAAAIPGKINYQGKLTDPDGELINEDYDISFSLFTELVEGEAVWSESHSEVRIWHGLFNVMLGVETPLNEVFQAYEPLFLEIEVDGEALSPRQKVLGAGYAIRTAGISVDAAGNVGIGTTEPEFALDVAGEILAELEGTEYFMVPERSVIMWSGSLASIPPGWHLCDGTNGTPDLRDRFIYGVSPGMDPGAVGGAASHTHTFSDTISAVTSLAGGHSHTYSQIPAHTHSASAFTGTLSEGNAHTHTMNPGTVTSTSAGSHTHGWYNVKSSFGTMSGRLGSSTGTNFEVATTAGRSHTHSLNLGAATSTTTGSHSHSVTVSRAVNTVGSASASTSALSDHVHTLSNNVAEGTTGQASNLPPYFKLAYLMAL